MFYFRARYYDPVLGRFISQDPERKSDSPNLYQGFLNNPISNRDAFGTDIWDDAYDVKEKIKKKADDARDAASDFVGGAYYQYVTDVSLGLSEEYLRKSQFKRPDSKSFHYGKMVGRVVAAGQSILEIGKGVSDISIGNAVAITTAGTPVMLVGIGETALGIAEVTHGSLVLYVQSQNPVNKPLHRPYKRKLTREKVKEAAPKTETGDYIDPNTGKVVSKEGPFDYGHKPGREHWRESKRFQNQGKSQKEYNEHMNDPEKYQIEDPSTNRSRRYEDKTPEPD